MCKLELCSHFLYFPFPLEVYHYRSGCQINKVSENHDKTTYSISFLQIDLLNTPQLIAHISRTHGRTREGATGQLPLQHYQKHYASANKFLCVRYNNKLQSFYPPKKNSAGCGLLSLITCRVHFPDGLLLEKFCVFTSSSRTGHPPGKMASPIRNLSSLSASLISVIFNGYGAFKQELPYFSLTNQSIQPVREAARGRMLMVTPYHTAPAGGDCFKQATD